MTKKAFLKLSSPVQYVKGIGPKRALYFKKIGVETVQDLLFLVPHRYVDYSTVKKIKDLKINDQATVIGRIQTVDVQRTRMRGSMIKLVITDDTGALMIRWFNRPDLKKRFQVGDILIASGKITFFRGMQLVNPLYEKIEDEAEDFSVSGTIIPIYPLTEGLSVWDIRRTMKIALDSCLGEIEETLPSVIRERHGLMNINKALKNIHLPETLEQASCARTRLVYDEFFFFELVLARRKINSRKQQGLAMRGTGMHTDKLMGLLPFQLTNGQKKVIQDIADDMARHQPMNRLLQGDVGSGKTVVALYAMLIAIENDYQAALMAPTEILAEQHYLVLDDLLRKMNIRSLLLTSSIKGKTRREAQDRILSGDVQIVFGTHALIEEGVNFHSLGLAIVDEQHRFGVMQRAALVNKGINPDFLVLSATPIPRTLALTLYGDLDISTLKEKPPSRGEVFTKIIQGKEKKKVFSFVRQELERGRQAFVICPIIEKSERLALRSAKEVHHEISTAFPDHTVGLIHGRIKNDERMKLMNAFRAGELHILVATTVIEVGVDVPNATVMIIEHPERFGLAQLHQLRGRIGRGSDKSFCYLFLSTYVAPETFERLTYFENNTDGFLLAQKDMKLRGPGTILGKRQHGLPDIVIGDLEDDRQTLDMARDDAFGIVKEDPGIEKKEYGMIKKRLDTLTRREQLLRIG
ncbi:MAG: ATP-dependent DNA helicase RecG [candidate division WOR-3 bacterium]|nr:MAG: ATP-dependent DNA helicase RecG [candidate division WOR-3 bacterium]